MRVGKKKQPTYRVVVADARSPRDGRIIETIGQYGPRQEPSLVQIDDARALEWLRKGAQPTEQVQKLLTVTGVWSTFEAEKSRPAVTQLSRRAYLTGRGPRPRRRRRRRRRQPKRRRPPRSTPPRSRPASRKTPSDRPVQPRAGRRPVGRGRGVRRRGVRRRRRRDRR